MCVKKFKLSDLNNIITSFWHVITCYFSKKSLVYASIQKVHSFLWIIFSIFVILLVLLSPVHAKMSDLFADGVSKGLDNWVTDLCDGMMNTGIEFQNESAISGNPVSGKIFDIATYTYDPFQNTAVHNAMKLSFEMWGVFMLMYILGGYILVNLKNMWPDGARAVTYITGINTESSLKKYVQNIFIGFAVVLFAYLAIYTILLLNKVLTQMVMVGVLPSIAPTPDNLVLYFMMGLTYLVMSFFFWIRFFTINLVTGFALFIGVAYIISNFTRRVSIWIMKFFISMVFMQFVIVLVTAWGVQSIEGAADMGFISLNHSISVYIALMILLVLIAAVMMVGWAFIKSGTTKAVRLVV
jgi:hypothetical protein